VRFYLGVFGSTITKCKILWGILENGMLVGVPVSEMPPLVCYRVVQKKD
jgi:hypothetical protein